MKQLTGINLQNIQTNQYQKNSNIPKYQTSNNPIKKWMEDLMCQETHEKMLNITNYWRNANQMYNEVSPHTGQNDHHQKNL